MFTYEKIIGLIEILRRHDDAPNTHAYGGAFHAAHKEKNKKDKEKLNVYMNIIMRGQTPRNYKWEDVRFLGFCFAAH